MVFLGVVFFVGGDFTVGGVFCFWRSFGSFTSGIILSLLCVGALVVESISFLCAGTGETHCTRQVNTNRGATRCAVSHNIELEDKK